MIVASATGRSCSCDWSMIIIKPVANPKDTVVTKAASSYQDAPNRTVQAGGVTFAYRDLGGSTGRTSSTIQAMADDAVVFIRALGLEQVDLHGSRWAAWSPSWSPATSPGWSAS